MTFGKEAAMRRRRLILLILNLLGGAALSLAALLKPDGLVANIIRATHTTWTKQPKFGLFHLVGLAAAVAVCVTVLALEKRLSTDTDNIIFYIWIAFFWLEIYKQLYYALLLSVGQYNFGILPFQLCSYVLYFFPLISLLKDGRLKDALYAFCALYLTVGGAVVLIYPFMFIEIPLAIHTMLWHTLMVASGLLLLKRGRIGTRLVREVIPASLVFLGTLALAILLNVLLTPLSLGSPEPLNLFYVSPYQQSNYILIGDVQGAFGWEASVLCYALIAIIGATALWGICKLCKRSTKAK